MLEFCFTYILSLFGVSLLFFYYFVTIINTPSLDRSADLQPTSDILGTVKTRRVDYGNKELQNTFKSSLTDIDGIGQVRAKALLKHFRTIENISNADLQELENAPKMTKDSAIAVYKYFHSGETGKNSNEH